MGWLRLVVVLLVVFRLFVFRILAVVIRCLGRGLCRRGGGWLAGWHQVIPMVQELQVFMPEYQKRIDADDCKPDLFVGLGMAQLESHGVAAWRLAGSFPENFEINELLAWCTLVVRHVDLH